MPYVPNCPRIAKPVPLFPTSLNVREFKKKREEKNKKKERKKDT